MENVKTKGKLGRRIGRVALIVLGLIVVFLFISTIVNQIISRNELVGIEPTGQFVEIFGYNMHIRSMGNGEQTIVLLPGLGTALPTESFAPLMRELAQDFTVVAIDYFGTGHSDLTSKPRTNANYVAEIRAALYAGGFSPPFILMPHSASGIYSEYFATRYPDEVTALILLDSTPTHEAVYMEVSNTIMALNRFLEFTGVTRITNRLAMHSFRGVVEDNGFTAQEVNNIRRFYNHALNPTMMEQTQTFGQAIREVIAIPFPQDIPVMRITPTNMNVGATMEIVEGHMTRFGANSQMIVLEGNHYVHKGNHVEIREAVNAFLGE